MLNVSFISTPTMLPIHRLMEKPKEQSSGVYSGTGDSVKYNNKGTLKTYIVVSPKELTKRIFCSLIPGVPASPPDISGPCLAMLLLAVLLYSGHSVKKPKAMSSVPHPLEALVLYATLIPGAAYISVRLAGASLTLLEMVCLIGYATFGHVLAMGIPVLFNQGQNEILFFWCLILFGGLSAMRVVIILLFSVRVPAARLVVCSLVATLHLLSLVFLHFVYIHTTYVYGEKS